MMTLEQRVERLERAIGINHAPVPELPIGGLTVRRIAQAASAEFRIRLNDLLGPKRYRHLNAARCATCWIAHHHTNRTLPQIAKALNRADHSTIIHRIRLAERLMAEDEVYRIRVEALRDRLLEAGVIAK